MIILSTCTTANKTTAMWPTKSSSDDDFEVRHGNLIDVIWISSINDVICYVFSPHYTEFKVMVC